MPKRKRGYDGKGRASKRKKTMRSGGTTRQFVPRSYGTPLAITERKYFDAEVAASAIAANGGSWAGSELDPAGSTLFYPTQGDDFNQRNGRKVQVLSIKSRGYINVPQQANQTAADSGAFIRFCIVLDKQTNATQLNGEDVITSGGASVAVGMFQNPAFFGRFQVLKDKIFILSNPNTTYDGTNIEQNGLIRQFKFNLKFRKPITVHYNSTNGGTVADVVDNSFHVIALTQSGDLAPTMNYKVRTTFIDI